MSPYIYVPWRLRKGETGKAASASPKSRQKKYLWTSSIALPLDCTATSGCERGWERQPCQPGVGTLLPWTESGLLIKEGSGNGCWVGTCCVHPGSCGNRGTLRMGVREDALLWSRVSTNIVRYSDNFQFTGVFSISFFPCSNRSTIRFTPAWVKFS